MERGSEEFAEFWQLQNETRPKAARLALQVGDEEWRRGQTKYAFEAYEAAGLPASELYEKAEKLLAARDLVKQWASELAKVKNLQDSKHHGHCEVWNEERARQKKCAVCVAQVTVCLQYLCSLVELLGWEEEAVRRLYPYREDVAAQGTGTLTAAAVAALKLVQRIKDIHPRES